jgi:hypothetical protein
MIVERIAVRGATGPTGATGATGTGLSLAKTQVTGPAGASNVDTTVYATAGSGNGRGVLTGIVIRVDTAMAGAGQVVLSVGTSAGGQQFILNYNLSGVAAGTLIGLNLSELGASFALSTGYSAALAGGDTIVMRLAGSGTITTAPVVTIAALGFTFASL